METHVTPARHAIASRRAAALREGWLRGGGSPAPAGQRRSDWFFCLILAVVTEGFQRALVRRSARAWQDIFGLSWEWNGRRGDSSTRWSGSCRTDSPPDICAFGGYCHRPSYFVPFLLRLRKRGGRLEVAGPIHLGQVECIATGTRPAFARLRLGRQDARRPDSQDGCSTMPAFSTRKEKEQNKGVRDLWGGSKNDVSESSCGCLLS